MLLFDFVQLLITIAFNQPVKLFSMKLQSSDFCECIYHKFKNHNDND